jgi:DNA repair protein RadD
MIENSTTGHMTKFNLGISVTNKIFSTKEEEKNFNKLLEEINPLELSIFREPEKLEKLFLSVNTHKLKNSQFRKKLIEGSFGTQRCQNFISKLGIKSISLQSSESQKQIFFNKINSFDWNDNKQTHAFVDSFELDGGCIPSDIIEKDLELLIKPNSPYFLMFDYQFEVFSKTKEKLSLPTSRRLIRVPTGGGKTKIAMEIVADFFNENKSSTIVWLAETEELLNQAANEFKKIWQHRGMKKVYVNRGWGTKNKIKPNIKDSKIIIAGLSKIMSYLSKDQFKADLIIFDEAHHSAAPEYRKAIRTLSKSSTKILGLTATPARGTEEETQKLMDLFHGNVPIQINTHDELISPVKFLQKKGVLAKLIFKPTIKIPEMSTKFTKIEIKKLLKSSDYTDKKILIKIGQDHLRNIRIAEKLLELNEEKKQVLYFAPSVEQSKLMHVLLTNFGIKSGVVDAKTPKEYRAELISKFQKKEINFLLNYNVFVAGFDAPVVDTVFIGRPTKSPNSLLQMIGRGMRGPNVIGGTSQCDIYFVEDKLLAKYQNFDSLYKAYDEYYEQEDGQNYVVENKLEENEDDDF